MSRRFLRSSLIAVVLLLVALSAFGAEDGLLCGDEEITSILRASIRGSFIIYLRDLIGRDGCPDRLEVRLIQANRGFSLPVLVALDTDCNGDWDSVYCIPSSASVAVQLWGEQVYLAQIDHEMVGYRIQDPKWEDMMTLVMDRMVERLPVGIPPDSM